MFIARQRASGLTTKRILLIGYGNPGRLDDGLGPACAADMERLGLENVRVESNYQLTVEDAADIAEHDIVVFADASVAGAEPFAFGPVHPCAEVSFTTHSVEPEALMAMATELFGAKTKGFALAIRGYEYNAFGEVLSPAAQNNLDQAVRFLAGVIEQDTFAAYDKPADVRPGRAPKVILDMSPADMN